MQESHDMTLGSFFDGIGGWLLAARHAGVTPVWASEIEPFPCSVTARHFPAVEQLGDITQIDPDEIEPVDIICAAVSGFKYCRKKKGTGWRTKQLIQNSNQHLSPNTGADRTPPLFCLGKRTRRIQQQQGLGLSSRA